MIVPAAYPMMRTKRFIAFQEQNVTFISVALEQRLSSIVPDVVATKEDGIQLIVQIKVKHSANERLGIASDSFAKRIDVPDIRFALKHGAKRVRAGSLSRT
jgi:hypothetical protein